MKKAYCNALGIQIHYRYGGQGKPLVLFHPSPRSSKALEPFGEMLMEDFFVIIPDIPNYGNSDALPIEIQTLYDYIPYFHAFFKELGLQNFLLYGSATGAQLGIAYALTHSSDILHLYLDNAAHFSDNQYQNITSQYFPDFSPLADGSHLTLLWAHIRDSFLYFPWFDSQQGKQLTMGLPPAEFLNELLLDYLKAGKRWGSAYKAAFLHERAEKVQALQTPTTLFRWEGSILLEYIDQLIAHPLPAYVQIVNTPSNLTARYESMKREIKKLAYQ
ncbi:MAG: alpha/beta hydrolase [Thermoflexibacter sp.]|jgi:pimeloyl-ACP methyl ester carboxylesterase|nr:alpha/beta hydrolase [Thermoflexibacter sp.]